MTTPSVEQLADAVLRRSAGRDRAIVGIAGPPGAGKSTLAEALSRRLLAARQDGVVVVPMDGFHLDNPILEARGLLHRKGAPETFDAEGLVCMLQRIRSGAGPVLVPVFDRERDLARAAACVVGPEHSIVLVEGNYLLLQDPPWQQTGPIFDLTISLEVDEAELRRRLVDRWIQHGLPADDAGRRAEQNDLSSARLIRDRSRPADIVWRDR